VHFVNESGNEHGVPNANCRGTVLAPKALPGQLCIYWSEYQNAEFAAVKGTDFFSLCASTAGAFIQFKEVVDNAYGVGSWAVTGG
jgi:hypothetical protein